MKSNLESPWIFKLVPFFIGFVFLVILAYWILIGTVLVKVSDKVEKEGLKGTVNEIWNGKAVTP